MDDTCGANGPASGHTSPKSNPELSALEQHGRVMFIDQDLAAQATRSRCSSIALSWTSLVARQLLAQSRLQSPDPLRPWTVSNVISPGHLHNLWDDSSHRCDNAQASSRNTSLGDAYWNPQLRPMHLPPMTTTIGSYYDDVCSNRTNTSETPPSLCHNWLSNGIAFDSSDFMSDYHAMSSQGTGCSSDWFGFNHTAFKLYSLWHVGYLLDDFYAYIYALASIFDCTILLAVPTIQSHHGIWAQCPPTFLTLWYRITCLTPLHHLSPLHLHFHLDLVARYPTNQLRRVRPMASYLLPSSR